MQRLHRIPCLRRYKPGSVQEPLLRQARNAPKSRGMRAKQTQFLPA
jgi:hypothetical protein